MSLRLEMRTWRIFRFCFCECGGHASYFLRVSYLTISYHKPAATGSIMDAAKHLLNVLTGTDDSNDRALEALFQAATCKTLEKPDAQANQKVSGKNTYFPLFQCNNISPGGRHDQRHQGRGWGQQTPGGECMCALPGRPWRRGDARLPLGSGPSNHPEPCLVCTL